MSDPGILEFDAALLRIAALSTANPLLDGPILPTLLGLAGPNVVALSVSVCVSIAETSYVGILGTEPLAAMALVFPFVILTMTMSSGAMGGGVASAIARALGAGDTARAAMLALHALMIGTCFGAVFTVVMLTFGPRLLALMGGHDRVLAEAVGYTTIFFSGAIVPWLMNTILSILRGTGNMRMPSALILLAATVQIALGGLLGLGFGPIPRFGMRGVASGTLIAFTACLAIAAWILFSGRSRLNLATAPLRFRREMFVDILKVGAIACFSPLQSVLTIAILTQLLSRFGTEVLAAYGIGARLEFLLTSVAFAVGIASVPMIGMAIGAGRTVRARRVAWTGGAISFTAVAAVGALVAVFPWLWVALFTSDPGVRAASFRYLAIAAPMYAFIGLNSSLYFSSQGAARILGPVLAQTARLVFIAAGGALLIAAQAGATSFYLLSGGSMVLLGVACAAAVKLTPWGSDAHDPRESKV
ncbi:MAG: MATE family efflux transporter [Xanthobacteraceae bacterium]|nr:MATE family efflux transporter [Xanthobacteraceae bacterium]